MLRSLVLQFLFEELAGLGESGAHAAAVQKEVELDLGAAVFDLALDLADGRAGVAGVEGGEGGLGDLGDGDVVFVALAGAAVLDVVAAAAPAAAAVVGGVVEVVVSVAAADVVAAAA